MAVKKVLVNTRILVFGAAAAAVIAAIAFFGFRSGPDALVAGTPDTSTGREIPPSSAKTSATPTASGTEVSPVLSFEADVPPVPATAMVQLHGLTPDQLDARLNEEGRDESWASTIEMALGDYLARWPYPRTLGSPSVECRKTLCRVQTTIDIKAFQAAPDADLRAALASMQHESLGREIVSVAEQLSVNAEHPDTITLSAYLQRVVPPGQSNP